MANNKKSIIVDGTTLFCNTRKPIKKDAKFHAGKFMIQLITSPDKVPDEIKNTAQYKLISYEDLTNIIPEDVEFPFEENSVYAEITVYSNYPFNFFDTAGQRAVSDELANLSVGSEVTVAYNIYENKQGKQANIAGVKMAKLEEFAQYNPFE